MITWRKLWRKTRCYPQNCTAKATMGILLENSTNLVQISLLARSTRGRSTASGTQRRSAAPEQHAHLTTTQNWRRPYLPASDHWTVDRHPVERKIYQLHRTPDSACRTLLTCARYGLLTASNARSSGQQTAQTQRHQSIYHSTILKAAWQAHPAASGAFSLLYSDGLLGYSYLHHGVILFTPDTTDRLLRNSAWTFPRRTPSGH